MFLLIHGHFVFCSFAVLEDIVETLLSSELIIQDVSF